ncbi:MAG: hypothetical protein R3Y65_05235 [Bacillota bacterium]
MYKLGSNMEDLFELELKLVSKIKKHKLGDKDEAFAIYNDFADLLKAKYGCIDRNFDESPKRRGSEWLDIHHLLEYELDNIARRTDSAKSIKKAVMASNEDQCCIVLTREEWGDQAVMNRIRKETNSKIVNFTCLDYTLEQLKPYNEKEKLVYANKIEHFLLHYLIDSIRGQQKFSGGPNYLWDDSVAIDIYGFDSDRMNNIKANKEEYYKLMTSEEITLLFRKLLCWKKWDTNKCSHCWTNFKHSCIVKPRSGVTYVENKDKFFALFAILGATIPQEIENNIKTLPYKIRVINWGGNIHKIINGDNYFEDEKTIYRFRGDMRKRFYTIPQRVAKISRDALRLMPMIEQITIPTTVEEIEDDAFYRTNVPRKDREQPCPSLTKIIYKGTKEEWDAKFSNVVLGDIKLSCKRASKKL